MIKIYGASDDLVEIENSTYKEDEIGCYNSDVRIRFIDGTVIRIGYPKKTLLGDFIAVWWIEVEKQGTASYNLTFCENEEAKIYSDIFEIDSEIKSHSVIKQKWGGEKMMLSNGKVAKMPDKLTDNEIIKALECCSNCDCGGCPCLTEDGCKDIDYSVILALINRLQAENERLNALIAETNKQRGAVIHAITHIDQVKAEAYKEFAERLKKKIFFVNIHNCEKAEIKCIDLKPEHIDNLLKELAGEDK